MVAMVAMGLSAVAAGAVALLAVLVLCQVMAETAAQAA
jgi:hypothetical protein